MDFKCLGDYLAKCNSSESRVIVPSNLAGVCADAFEDNLNVTDLILPENILYCVSIDSRLRSHTVKTLTIHNVWFSGILDVEKLPALRRVEILDIDTVRLSSIRAGSLINQIAQLPDTIEIYFPHCNLYACDRNDFTDVKLCVRFLNSKWLYDEESQKAYAEYIKLHEYAILQYLVEHEHYEALRSFIPTADPTIISKALDILQELEDTEIVALALDVVSKSGKPTSGSAFDLSFLDDIISEAPAQEAPAVKTEVFKDEVAENFEIRGVEGNCLVVGAYLGDPCDCFIIPKEIKGCAVEGIGAPMKQPTASPIAIAIGANIKAIFRHALTCYGELKMLLLTQHITFIDSLALDSRRLKEITIYCPPGCYADNWARENGFRVKSAASFMTDLKSQGVSDV